MQQRTIRTCITLILAFITSVSYAFNDAQLEKNKQTVIEFYNAAINQKDFATAAHYLGPYYTQHNPNVADGREGLKTFIQFLHDQYPNAHSDIKKIFAENDYVILHIHSIREPGTRGRAIFDLFRLENGKIVEHWDTVQDIPEKSVNTNSMF